MDGHTRRIAWKATAVSVIAVAGTYAISFSVRAALHMPFDWLAWIECFVIPVVIAAPVSSYIFWQSERVAEACEALAQSEAELKTANAALAYRASHDGMTGLLNREAFVVQLARSIRGREDAVLLLLDADHFKQVNDCYGHVAGDDALRAISDILRDAISPEDIIGRLGGEEFGIILKGCTLQQAEEMAERLRRRVECRASELAGLGPSELTVSIGGAATLEGDSTSVLRQADRCLYEAKRRGRNTVALTYSTAAIA